MSPSRSTVFIIGAGASTEFGFPVGPVLATKIARRVAFGISNYGEISAVDQSFVLTAVRALFGQGDAFAKLHLLHPLCEQIRSTVKLAPSIDNFLDIHQLNKELLMLGKIAIAYEIAWQEGQSVLANPDAPRFTDYINDERTEAQGSWYLEFFRALIERCPFDELASRLRSICVISFNYDRTLEQFLLLAISRMYGRSIDESADVLKALLVYHPYGSLGPLQGSPTRAAVPYGFPLDRFDFLEIARGIRTFTEGSEDSDPVKDAVSSRLISADRFVFLGFGFLSANMQLLKRMRDGHQIRGSTSLQVFGTAYKVSLYNADQIRRQIGDLLNLPKGEVILEDATCEMLMRNYSQGLKFA